MTTPPRPVAGALLLPASADSATIAGTVPPTGCAGSRSFKECHERFYALWSTSFHGLAMQPYGRELAAAKLGPQAVDIAVGKYRYRADVSGAVGENLGVVITNSRHRKAGG